MGRLRAILPSALFVSLSFGSVHFEVRRLQPRSLSVALENLKLMAQCDVLQGELSAGSEGRGESVKDEFEHPDMLYPSSRNSNDTRGDEIFGNDKARIKPARVSNTHNSGIDSSLPPSLPFSLSPSIKSSRIRDVWSRSNFSSYSSMS